MRKMVLVTGASGFIAQQIIVDLLSKDYRVRGTIRSLSKEQNLRQALSKHSDKADQIEFVATDLEEDEGWDEAVAGVDCVMHVASPFYAVMPKDPQDMIRPAKEGTLRVLRAAAKAAVKRVVLTSSCAAIAYGYEELPEVLDESNWTDAYNTKDCPAYQASKTIAEKAAWDYVNSDSVSLELTVINPCGVFGPILSEDVRTSVGLIEQLISGKVPMLFNATMQVIDVRDVSEAHIAAMERPEANGHRFALAGGCHSLLESAGFLSDAFPEYASRVPTKTLPDLLIRFLGLFGGQMKTATYELGKRRYVSGEKAKKMLFDGRDYISARDSLVASAQSLIAYGVVE